MSDYMNMAKYINNIVSGKEYEGDDNFKSTIKEIQSSTSKLFNHNDGVFTLHDGFLTVTSEKKHPDGFVTSLSGYGFVHDKKDYRTLGRSLVSIDLHSQKPLREINNKELYSFNVYNGILALSYHQDRKLKSVISNVSNISVTLGDLMVYKKPDITEFPATITVSLRQWQNQGENKKPEIKNHELDALWSSNRIAYVLSKDKKIPWREYDLKSLGFVERADIYLKDERSVKSKLKQDNYDDFFNTNNAINTHIQKLKNKKSKKPGKKIKI